MIEFAEVALAYAGGDLPTGVEPPLEVAYLWGWFLELAARRRFSDLGAPHAMDWREIAAWAGLTGRRPSPWDVRQLVALDGVAMSRIAGEAAPDRRGIHSEVAATNVEGIKALFAGLGTKAVAA